ncbi:MAG: helix-turn-helix transcriptional regulator [Oscillospiraceae bacterium]|nr:helix-turn-helix transcriptional regulator [Oscillospiraceae bacterium]
MNSRLDAGAEMARMRKEKKMTQAELANALGVSQRMVAACELGERKPSVKLAQKIETELGLSWTIFYEGGLE